VGPVLLVGREVRTEQKAGGKERRWVTQGTFVPSLLVSLPCEEFQHGHTAACDPGQSTHISKSVGTALSSLPGWAGEEAAGIQGRKLLLPSHSLSCSLSCFFFLRFFSVLCRESLGVQYLVALDLTHFHLASSSP
jgi:hypothetical protein